MPRLAALILFLAMPGSLSASPLSSVLPEAEQRGSATFRYLGFPLYEARLFTQAGEPLDGQSDFGLELTYLRNLKQYDLVESTMRELKRTGGSLPVRNQLNMCFADVKAGDRFLAISQGANKIRFWLNGRATCNLIYPDITNRFMGIFVGEDTRSRSFTRQLRGE